MWASMMGDSSRKIRSEVNFSLYNRRQPPLKGGTRIEDAGLLGHQSRFRFIQVMARTVEDGGCSVW